MTIQNKISINYLRICTYLINLSKFNTASLQKLSRHPVPNKQKLSRTPVPKK